jgi:hypothetical protein
MTNAPGSGMLNAIPGNTRLNDMKNDLTAAVLALRHVCEKGFEHSVLMTQSHSAAILAEAFGNYFGWEVYNHQEPK